MRPRAEQLKFEAKALRREDGKYDPCIEATVFLNTGSKIVETNVVGSPKIMAEHAIEEANSYLIRRKKDEK